MARGRARGRPKAFEEIAVLDRAMEHFWTHGYRASGVTELVEHLGIARQSLYRTFGSKQGLFIRVIEHYRDTQLSTALAILERDGSPLRNVREAIAFFERLALDHRARGCLVANALVEAAPDDAPVATLLGEVLAQLEDAFASALHRAQECGELPSSKRPRALARALTNAVVGLAVTGRLGKEPAAVADIYAGTVAMLG